MLRTIILSGLLIFSSVLAEAQSDPNILILNSYHRGYLWTDQQSDAMLATLVRDLPKARIEVQYIDWKRYPTPETLTRFFDLISHHYKDSRPDLILTTDDAALLFALDHRKDLFGQVPIVFAGIFERTGETLMGQHKDLTGVFEAIDLEGTIQVALELWPQATEAVIIHDSSETSLTMEQDLRDAMKRISPDRGIKVLTAMPFKDLLDNISKLPPSAFILLASYARDSEGLVKQPEEFAELMNQVSPVPIFTFYEHMMGKGVVGGSLLSGTLQGQAAAHLAARILTHPGQEFPGALYDKTVYYSFDWTQLAKYGLQSKDLPAGSMILHKPFDFFQEYRSLVIAVALVFLVLLALIIMLVINIQRRSRTESRLRETNAALEQSQERYRQINDELEQRVEQRTHDLSLTNKELEQSIIQLNIAREQLVQREKLAALGNLVAGVAHELNTPIGSALTMASGLDERITELRNNESNNPITPDQIDQFTQWAHQGAGLLVRTLTKAADLISSFKQIAVDRSNIQRRRFMLQDVVAQEVAVMQVDAVRYHAVIIPDVAPDLEMDGYPGMIGQILDNLVQNSLVHGLKPKKGGEIHITAQPLDESTIRLTVSDNGAGIPEELHSRVFEPFFTTAFGQGGSGLGLHIVYNLVQALNGSIVLFTPETGGACFRIDLPSTSPETITQGGQG